MQVLPGHPLADPKRENDVGFWKFKFLSESMVQTTSVSNLPPHLRASPPAPRLPRPSEPPPPQLRATTARPAAPPCRRAAPLGPGGCWEPGPRPRLVASRGHWAAQARSRSRGRAPSLLRLRDSWPALPPSASLPCGCSPPPGHCARRVRWGTWAPTPARPGRRGGARTLEQPLGRLVGCRCANGGRWERGGDDTW